ncbi:WecB/TagA/CpsF family glycosyltransferase [Pelagibacterium sp. H642]|uniref:WecB/TagA/CpsF family glycosyltransferase n=1 Tax=Pelagibacterium sp. H642 TaxID=1881069 RepID=UPI002814DD3C|nr:WecB/TagA/CpsF family glycosyltransferase [Pelagibacterium sp. H642]WMT92826.1 WecB/TagA/CpsF family glycosyltransferase [Pelagibacterium sp. H642]
MLQKTFARFGVLGLPIDDLELSDVIDEIDFAVRDRRRLMIATVNTNFLICSQTNPAFRRSILDADLCTVDGTGVLLVCRLLSAPVKARVSGADILERLFRRSRTAIGRPLRVFFFGGAPGMAVAAKRRLEDVDTDALVCVGALDPGFGTVEELSRPDFISAINDTSPDLLLVALGAEKGQAWLVRNGPLINAPVRSHFGAAIGFLGGTVRRAPGSWQKLGLEWLWRIKEEPKLASRYWNDGLALLRLVALRIVPQAIAARHRRHFCQPRPFLALAKADDKAITLKLVGTAIESSTLMVREYFEAVRASPISVRLDIADLDSPDVSLIGDIMRLRHDLTSVGGKLTVLGASPHVSRQLGFVATE